MHNRQNHSGFGDSLSQFFPRISTPNIGSVERSIPYIIKSLDISHYLKDIGRFFYIPVKIVEGHRFKKRELEHYAEFGRISAVLLHEIANPLTAATLNLGNIRNNTHALRDVSSNLKQLERYIDAARKQLKTQGGVELFNVNKELKLVSLVMIPLAKKQNIAISINVENNMKIYGDSVKFCQIIANLITNSIDAYDKSSNFDKRIVVTLRKLNSWIIVEVSDNGVGIQPSIISRIFDPFYTTKSCQRGSGIGLSMVRRAVESDFHGSVAVVSKPGVGTKFFIKLSTGLAIS